MKTKGLGRVVALYGQLERVRLMELQEAAAAVVAVDRLRAEAEAAGVARRSEGRAALARGEGMAWRMAESACEAAEVVVARAAAERTAREASRLAAVEVHRASRLRAEQALRVAEVEARAVAATEGRREQAATDDRYAARLCWTRMKAG